MKKESNISKRFLTINFYEMVGLFGKHYKLTSLIKKIIKVLSLIPHKGLGFLKKNLAKVLLKIYLESH